MNHSPQQPAETRDIQPNSTNYFWKWLVPFGRKALRLPVLRLLAPSARRVLSVAQPAGRLDARTAPPSTPQPGCGEVRVMSANLCHDWPLRRNVIERLEAFSQMVENSQADVLLLQEVSRTKGLFVDRWLAERLGMGYVYARANGHQNAIGFEEGLAIFSRYPLRAPALTELDRRQNPFVRRLALGATLETPCGLLPAFSVHLGLFRSHNREQMMKLRHWVSQLTGPVGALIGGDFNTHETSPQIQQAGPVWRDAFRSLHPQADAATHELRWPWGGKLRSARLDYVFVQQGNPGWSVAEARHLESPLLSHSDHRAVFARLAFSAA